MEVKEVEINGITYTAIPELYTSCDGCVAENDSNLCDGIIDKSSCFYNENIIWIKKESTTENKGATMTKETDVSTKKETTEEPKYTVDEVLEAVEDFDYFFFTNTQADALKDYLAKKDRPDYQLYLKLKAQFGE